MLQTTLHSFWNISPPSGFASAGPAFPQPGPAADEPRCGECDGQVAPPGLAADGARLRFVLGDCTCRGCGRVACDLCAVGVAETRACLRCSC
jgi:hypothetical protein